MKILTRHIVCILITFLASFNLFAQNAIIEDFGIKTCIRNNYPSLLGDSDDELSIVATNEFTDTLKCMGHDVESLIDLQYFISTTVIDLSDNNISEISDLSMLVNLKSLNLDSNSFYDAPDLSFFTSLEVFKANKNFLMEFPVFPIGIKEIDLGDNNIQDTVDLVGLTQLESLELYGNDIKGFKSISYLVNLVVLDLNVNDLADLPELSMLSNLQIVDLSDNRFKTLPIMDLTNIQSIDINHNKLTFDDFIPFTQLSDFESMFLGYENQSTQVVARTDSVEENEFWDWVLPFDVDLTSNTYFWYKDGLPYDTTSIGTLDIDNVNNQSSGVYHCEVVNSASVLLGTRIVTNTRTLYVELEDVLEPDCFTILDASVSVNIPRCTNLALINLDFTIEGDTQGELIYVLNDIDTVSTDFKLSQEGSYTIKLMDDVCTVNSQEELMVEFDLTDCEPTSFSPNDDGIEDQIYLEETGVVKIYDKSARLLKTIETPAFWDGTDKDGIPLPLGHYILILNEESSESVTLIR